MAEGNSWTEEERSSRDDLAIKASGQIEGLCHMVLAELRLMQPAGVGGVVAAIIRMRELSKATMSAIGDEVHAIDDLHQIVHGYLPDAN